MTAIKKGSLVRIVWQDAEADSGWKTEEEIEQDTLASTMCETVGFLVKLPTKVSPMYFVASTKSEAEETHWNAIMKIPKAWVKDIKPL